MKKVYLTPVIEAIELRFASMICVSDPNNSIDDGMGNSMFGGGGGAPQRKPF